MHTFQFQLGNIITFTLVQLQKINSSQQYHILIFLPIWVQFSILLKFSPITDLTSVQRLLQTPLSKVQHFQKDTFDTLKYQLQAKNQKNLLG